MLSIVVLGVAILLLGGRYGSLASGIVIIGGFLGWGAGVVVAAGAALVASLRRFTRARRSDAIDEAGITIAVASAATAAGIPFRRAMTQSGGDPAGRSTIDIRRALRSLDQGTSVDVRDPDLAAMFEAARLAEATGTPLAPRLDALLRRCRADQAARTRVKLAKLPVKLLFPLAFLILPGFILLVVVPAVALGLGRLTL